MWQQLADRQQAPAAAYVCTYARGWPNNIGGACSLGHVPPTFPFDITATQFLGQRYNLTRLLIIGGGRRE